MTLEIDFLGQFNFQRIAVVTTRVRAKEGKKRGAKTMNPKEVFQIWRVSGKRVVLPKEAAQIS